jgi:hypothetical protein
MGQSELKRKHHYIPASYLRRWVDSDGRIWTYRILVSNAKVPLWKRNSPEGIAYHLHLYTRIAEGQATDEVERWLDKEYENPSQPIIERAVAQKRLTPEDWTILIRYMACQDVRTPVRLLGSLKRQEETMQSLMQGALEKVKHKLEQGKAEPSSANAKKFAGSELLPLNISLHDDPVSDSVKVEARSTTGRSAWLFGIKYLLQNSRSLDALLGHKWTILRAPRGMSLCTSDNPVIRLNYHSNERYDLKGGWGSKGTEIIFPLDTGNVLYTKIGDRPPPRGTVVSLEVARFFQRIILENAHRFIFCPSKCDEAAMIRPRTEDASIFKHEQAQWDHWHNRNMEAESRLHA